MIHLSQRFFGLMNLFWCVSALVGILFVSPLIVQSKLLVDEVDNGISFSRSLESLRDLDFETWQLIAYPKEPSTKTMILRV